MLNKTNFLTVIVMTVMAFFIFGSQTVSAQRVLPDHFTSLEACKQAKPGEFVYYQPGANSQVAHRGDYMMLKNDWCVQETTGYGKTWIRWMKNTYQYFWNGKPVGDVRCKNKVWDGEEVVETTVVNNEPPPDLYCSNHPTLLRSAALLNNWTVDEQTKVCTPPAPVVQTTPTPTPTPNGSITIKKIALDKKGNQINEVLPPFTFKINGVNGNAEVTTDQNGNVMVKDVIPGTYTVVETGYADEWIPGENSNTTITVKPGENFNIVVKNQLKKGNKINWNPCRDLGNRGYNALAGAGVGAGAAALVSWITGRPITWKSELTGAGIGAGGGALFDNLCGGGFGGISPAFFGKDDKPSYDGVRQGRPTQNVTPGVFVPATSTTPNPTGPPRIINITPIGSSTGGSGGGTIRP